MIRCCLCKSRRWYGLIQLRITYNSFPLLCTLEWGGGRIKCGSDLLFCVACIIAWLNGKRPRAQCADGKAGVFWASQKPPFLKWTRTDFWNTRSLQNATPLSQCHDAYRISRNFCRFLQSTKSSLGGKTYSIQHIYFFMIHRIYWVCQTFSLIW